MNLIKIKDLIQSDSFSLDEACTEFELTDFITQIMPILD